MGLAILKWCHLPPFPKQLMDLCARTCVHTSMCIHVM